MSFEGKSQGGLIFFLFAVLLLMFFILGVSYFYQVTYVNSNPSALISDPSAYTSKNVDCYSRKAELGWNNQKLEECLNDTLKINSS